jgi:hypothetical protein
LAIVVLVADVFVTTAMGWKAGLWLDIAAIVLMLFAMVWSPRLPFGRS